MRTCDLVQGVILVTAEEGSLSAGARALGLAQPTLGRACHGIQHFLSIACLSQRLLQPRIWHALLGQLVSQLLGLRIMLRIETDRFLSDDRWGRTRY